MSRACEENFVRKLFSLHWAIPKKKSTPPWWKGFLDILSGGRVEGSGNPDRRGHWIWKNLLQGLFPNKCNLKRLDVWHALWICKLLKSFRGMYVSLSSIITVNTQKTWQKDKHNIGVTAKKAHYNDAGYQNCIDTPRPSVLCWAQLLTKIALIGKSFKIHSS